MAALKYLFSFLFIVFAPSLAIAANCNGPSSIVRVSNSASGGFEYVDFKIKKPAAPRFFTTNVLPPFLEDPSGTPINIAGSHWTKIQFRDVDSYCSILQFLSLPKPAIRAIKNIEQFEGQISFIVGRSASSHYISTKVKNGVAFTTVRVKFKP